jgi:hypothetical protein
MTHVHFDGSLAEFFECGSIFGHGDWYEECTLTGALPAIAYDGEWLLETVDLDLSVFNSSNSIFHKTTFN